MSSVAPFASPQPTRSPRAVPLPAVVTLAVTTSLLTSSLHAQPGPVSLEPLDPIGCLACAGPRAFGAIGVVVVTGDGGVVVADRDAPMVRVFDAAGGVVRTMGRRGEGPGEFRFLSGLAVLADGSLLVSDMMAPRLTLLGPDGDVRSTARLEGPVIRLSGDPGGRRVAAQEAQWATMSAAVHLVGREGQVVATPLPTTADRILDGEGRPVAPGLLSMAVDDEGHVAVAESYTYRIEVLDSAGRVLRTMARSIPRSPRTESEIQELRGAMSRGRAKAEAAQSGAAASAGPEIDPLRPHFLLDGLRWDDRGRLWVRTARGGPGRTVFDLFSREGTFLGEVPLPVEVGPWDVAQGVLAGVVEDPDFGVQTVARWRVVG